MTQQRLCLKCSRPFEVPATSKRQFCSTACHPKQTHSRRPKDLASVVCARPGCRQEFQRKQWEVKRAQVKGWDLYCSVACRDAVKRGRKGEQRSARVQLKCEACKRSFEVLPGESVGRRFCSQSCANTKLPGRPALPDTRIINSKGYAFVYVPRDERPPGKERWNRHAEHRYVMSKILGRWPTHYESVHHINGNKLDNRPENLQLHNGQHGSGHAVRCRQCGSHDIEFIEIEQGEATQMALPLP